MNLRHFLTQLKGEEGLIALETEIDPCLEIAVLTDCESKRNGKALQFNNLSGTDLRVASNLFGSDRRMAMALGAGSLQEFGEDLTHALQLGPGKGSNEKLGNLLSKVQSIHVEPAGLSVLPDLDSLPELQFWPHETRSFFTLAIVVSCHPETHAPNYGIYRLGKAGKTQMTLNLLPGSGCGQHLDAWHALGKAMPIAVLFGASPSLIFSSAANLPKGCREDLFACWIEKEPLALAKSDSGLPFELPAEVELIMEGEVKPGQTLNEGPFGCFLGDYGGMNNCPLIDLKSMRHQQDAILPVTLAGPLPMEDVWLAQARLELERSRLCIDVPEIDLVWQPIEAAFSGLYFVCCASRVSAVELAGRLKELKLLRPLRGLVVCTSPPYSDWQRKLEEDLFDNSWRSDDADLSHLCRNNRPILKHPAVILDGLKKRLSSSELQQLKL